MARASPLITALTKIAYANIIDRMKSRKAAPFYDARRYHVDDGVGYLMKRITTQMRRRIERRMAEHGLTEAQWVPLWLLANGQGDTAQALTCAIDMDPGAMTRMLDRLEAKGLIARERSAEDRRVVRLSLTRAGQDIVRHVPGVLAEVNNSALQGFSAEEFATLKALLGRMLATLASEEVAA